MIKLNKAIKFKILIFLLFFELFSCTTAISFLIGCFCWFDFINIGDTIDFAL